MRKTGDACILHVPLEDPGPQLSPSLLELGRVFLWEAAGLLVLGALKVTVLAFTSVTL